MAQYCRRIKLPENLTNLFVNMFDERKISIITEFGLSDPLTAATGIDQGEVVSPLLWRIFYDPLLSRIQQDIDLGYTMTCRWPTTHNTWNNHDARFACLAFADDTAWIARSKHDLETMIDITNQFFVLNDIGINGSKSELMVLNPSTDTNNRYIIMGSDNAHVQAISRSETIRYLGVWFSPTLSQKHHVNIAKKEINTITSVIKNKSITIDQVKYINNRVLIPRLEYRLSTPYFLPAVPKLFTLQ